MGDHDDQLAFPRSIVGIDEAGVLQMHRPVR